MNVNNHTPKNTYRTTQISEKKSNPSQINPQTMVASAKNDNPINSIERSAIATLDNLPPFITLNLTHFTPKNIDQKKIPITELGLSQNSLEIMQKNIESGDYGINSPALISLIYSLHKQLSLFKEFQNTTVCYENLKEILIELDDILNGYFYLSFAKILDSTRDFLGGLNEQLPRLLASIKTIILSNKFEMLILNRFKINKDKLDKLKKIKGVIQKYISEMEKTSQCILELVKLSQDKFDYINSLSFNELMDNKKISINFPKELAHYKNSVIAIANEGLKIEKLEKFIICSPDNLKDAFDNMLKLVESKYSKTEDFLNQYYLVEQSFHILRRNYVFSAVCADIAENTEEKYEEVLSVLKLLIAINEIDPLSPYLFNSIFYAILAYSLDEVYLEIEKKYRFYLSESALISLNVIWKKMNICNEEDSLESVTMHIDKFIDGLQTYPFLKPCSREIVECLQKMSALAKYLKKNSNENILPSLKRFINCDINLHMWLLINNDFQNLKEDIIQINKLMNKCNAALQKALSQFELSDPEFQNLETALQDLKTDISQVFAPLFSLPGVMDSLILDESKMKKINIKTYKPELEDNIKELFNIDFKKYKPKKSLTPQPIEVQKTPELTLEIKEGEHTIKIQKENKPSIKIGPEENRKDEDRPKTTKTQIILNYLDECGWKPLSKNGSHLKLIKSEESLIVPVNKPNIAKGTLGAIFRQKEKKEHRIEEKSESKK